MTPKQQFIEAYDRESATTIKVLRAYPEAKGDLKPHHLSRSARELAWIFVEEQSLCHVATTTGFDWTKPAPHRKAPDTIEEITQMFDSGRQEMLKLVGTKDDALSGTVKFPVGPGKIGDIPLGQFLWMILCDQIHHRGQFSIYLRMADGKVPSIYGPTHDEPWF